ncbi:MAG: penicillin-binding protein 2 [bacterium]|nr:penicillin-binding protein 2 [bacterium]
MMASFFHRKKDNNSPFVVPEVLISDAKLAELPALRYAEGISPAGQKNGEEYLKKIIAGGYFKSLFYFFVFIGVIFFIRSAGLQIVQGQKFEAVAEKNRIRLIKIAPERGLITDRNGIILASNRPQFILNLVPADLPASPEEKQKMLEKISSLTELSPDEINKKIQVAQKVSSVFDPVILLDDVEYNKAIALKIASETTPGLSVDVANRRTYAAGEFNQNTFSHIIGYVGYPTAEDILENKDKYNLDEPIGKSGLEFFYDDLLRGKNGQRKAEVDARGKIVNILAEDAPVPGKTMVLNIDAPLQQAVVDFLSAELRKLKLKRGAAIILNPHNGEILSLVSLPSYDNERFLGGMKQEEYQAIVNDRDYPLFNRAIAGEYPPGSTFKLIMSSAALQEKIINAATSFLSVGGIRVSQWFFPDWKAGGHGLTNARKALAESINTFFYIIGGGYQDFAGLGLKKIVQYAASFGFGQKTGIDLPGEKDGFLPTNEWKEEKTGEVWYIGDTYHLSIGQGYLLATPLQIARETAAIANGGKLITPKLWRENGKDDLSAQDGFLRKEVVDTVRAGLRDAVVYGSARQLAGLPVTVAGKTGTAEWQKGKNPHAWFTGFVPYENPQIVVTVLIEEGGEGSAVSVPVAGEIINWWYNNRINPPQEAVEAAQPPNRLDDKFLQ